MEEELYINDKLIDLPSRSIAQTLQVNDIAEVKDRNANYTNNIKIPMTPNNVKNLEMLAVAGNTTTLPYSSVKIKYVVNGVELISDGKGLLKKSNKFYNLIVYDGNIVLTELVGKSTLSELDWSTYNHNLTESVYTGSWSNTSGFIYPLGAFYSLFSLSGGFTQPFCIDVSTPMMYIHTVFDMIFSQRGYSITGDIFTDTEFKERVMSMNNGFNRTSTNSQSQVYFKSTALDPAIDWSEDYTGQGTLQTYTKGSYTVSQTGSHEVKCLGSITVVYGVNYRLAIEVNGAVRKFFDFESGVQFNLTQDINVNAGDLVEIVVHIYPQEYAEFNKVQFSTAFNIYVYKNTYSIPINFEELIGDTLQIDFLKSIMQHFGLIFRKVKNENTFEFVQISELLSDRSGAEDWSDKYVGVVDEDYKPPYARRNWAKYNYDDIEGSNIQQTYADGFFALDNDRLPEEKTLFTSIFKAGVIDNSYYRHKHWVNKDGIITINGDGLRMYKLTQVSDTVLYRYKFEGVAWSTHTGTVAKLVFLDFHHDIGRYYLQFKQMLETYKSTIINVNLTVTDVYKMDFFKLKYFKQLGAYYYLNKVINFKKGRITRVQVIKLGADVTGLLNAGSANYAGSSNYSGTLSKNAFGSIIGSYAGSSNYSGTLRGIVVSSFSISVNSNTSNLTACTETSFETNYHNGANALPDVNDTVYTDASGLSPKNGGGNYWKITRGGVNYWIVINASGLVTSKGSCSW